MTGVLNQLEAFGTARRELVQTPRAFVFAVLVLGPDDTLSDELQPGSASIAPQTLVHAVSNRAAESMLSRSICLRRWATLYSVLLRLPETQLPRIRSEDWSHRGLVPHHSFICLAEPAEPRRPSYSSQQLRPYPRASYTKDR